MESRSPPDAPVRPSAGVLDETQKDAIRRQLGRILESTAFRASKRSQQCLRFIVEKTLDGHLEVLKERCIGAEVFGRTPDYDTNTDAVVRISANELRKRLAQYHVTADPNEEVRIDLPAGSYIPEFHWLSTPTTNGSTAVRAPVEVLEPAKTHPGRRLVGRKTWLLAGLGLLLLALAAAMPYFRKPSALDQFWAPVFQSPRPVLISVGQPVVYLLSRRIHEQYDGSNAPELESGPHVVKYGAASIPGSDVIPVSDQFTGIGDAVALGRLTEMLGKAGKPSQIRFGDTSFADLRNSPAVLISAFTNRWSLEIARELRFSFEWQNFRKMISDRTPPGRIWATEMDASGHTRLDYALICRFFNAATSQPIVQAGGITQYGTQAAGEFLTNSRYWEPLLHQVPRDWPSRNLQVVIRAKVIGNFPSTPEIVAIHCW